MQCNNRDGNQNTITLSFSSMLAAHSNNYTSQLFFLFVQVAAQWDVMHSDLGFGLKSFFFSSENIAFISTGIQTFRIETDRCIYFKPT